MTSRTSINASDMSMEALFSVVSSWDMTVPIFIAYSSPIAPDNNNCVGLASRNYIELWSVSGRHYQLVQGQSDTWIDITNNMDGKLNYTNNGHNNLYALQEITGDALLGYDLVGGQRCFLKFYIDGTVKIEKYNPDTGHWSNRILVDAGWEI